MSRTANDRRIFASLREIHEAARMWQTEVSAILDTPPEASSDFKHEIAAQAKRKHQIDTVVHDGIKTIRTIFAEDHKEHEWGAQVLINIELSWQALGNLWPPDENQREQSLKTLRSVRRQLDQVVYECLSVVLTPDINDRLPNLEVGQALNLEFVYGTGFPLDPNLHKRLVDEIAQEQGIIHGGVFDPDSGLIYRVAPTEKERRKSCWRLAFLILCGALVAVAACFIRPILPGWPIPTSRFPALLMNYVFLFVGAGGHVIIDALKQQRSRAASSFTAMDDWIMWLHVRETSVRYSILWICLGFILLTAMVPDMDWRGAFVAGYSIDSITDLFLSRFEGAVGKAATQIKQSLPPA